MSDRVTVTVEHTRACGYCARGVRTFYRRHGLDFRAFLREGTPSDVLEAIGDGMAVRAVEEARRGL